MKIISAIGSFKGTIDSVKINSLVKSVLENKGYSVEAIPVADGGDGLLDSLCTALGGEYKEVETVNALGGKITSKVGVAAEVGLCEMALASGLAILKEEECNPLKASTYGTGVLIKYLVDLGIKNIILGIGGSATNDGGMGCLSALGFCFYDEKGKLLKPCGENLINVRRITAENVCDGVKKLQIQIACDVTNPLLGESGATYVYAPQKGANENMLAELEEGMKNYASVVAEFCGCDYSKNAGAGAAGGLGFGLLSLLGARLQKGAQIVLDCADYPEKVKNADLVITGEGRIDNQTEFGKLLQIVSKIAKENNVKCIAVAGSSQANEQSLKNMGISEIYQLIDFAPLSECMGNTVEVVKILLNSLNLF